MIGKYLTTEQVANILQVHPFTILRYLKKGKLKGVKLGRVYRIKESDVYEFLESISTSPAEEKKSKEKLKTEKEPEKIPTVYPNQEVSNSQNQEILSEEEKPVENTLQQSSTPTYTLSHQDDFEASKDDSSDNQTYYVI